MLTVQAPAKINLTLEVIGKRRDGYHEIRSVLQAIDLYDTLNIVPGKGISFRCDMPGWTPKNSILPKVVKLIQKASGCKQGAVVTIEKRIPLLSGLGGDSSDAAALLKGLHEFWGLSLPETKLMELAVKVGSDVAFFLRGGTASASGRGEIISSLAPLPKTWFLVFFPGTKVDFYKTTRMYAALKPERYTDGLKTEKLVTAIKEGKPLHFSMLFNVFKDIAFHVYANLISFNVRLIKAGICEVQLAGSGPTLFAMFPDQKKAEMALAGCKEQSLNTLLAASL